MNWQNLAGKVLLKCIMEENHVLLLKFHIILIKQSSENETTSTNVLQNRSKRIKKIRSEAAKNTKRLDKRMVDKHKKGTKRWGANTTIKH